MALTIEMRLVAILEVMWIDCGVPARNVSFLVRSNIWCSIIYFQ
jgi:hypothetical protein